jgi:hypothetical protein
LLFQKSVRYQSTFKTTTNSEGVLVYDSVSADHDNQDISPVLEENIGSNTLISTVLQKHVLSDSSKGNWVISTRDMTRVNAVVDYMLNAASTTDKDKLYTAKPLLKAHSNESEAIQFGKEFIREKSLWENEIVEASRSISVSTKKKLLLEELKIRNKEVVYREKTLTLSAVDRRISILKSNVSGCSIDKDGDGGGDSPKKHSMGDTADFNSDDQSSKKIRSNVTDFSDSNTSSSSSANPSSSSTQKKV